MKKTLSLIFTLCAFAGMARAQTPITALPNDVGASRAVIDTNFANLNAGKVEKYLWNSEAATTLAVSAGSVTVTQTNHILAAQSGTTDDIVTFTGGAAGDWLIVSPDSGDVITINDNSGSGTNIVLGGFATLVLSDVDKFAAFQRDAANWVLRWVSPNVTRIKTPVYSYSSGQSLTAEQQYGSVIFATAALELEAAAGAVGMAFTVKVKGAFAVSCDPDSSDLMHLDGTALDAGDKATTDGTSGQIQVWVWDGTDWDVTTNGSTDGGA